jgi:tetratricopeptide (TPR) repeat protein
MNIAVLPRGTGSRRIIALMFAWTVCGGAAPHCRAQGQSIDPAAGRNVQAIPLQSANNDGQTSWIIEPEVPRIPKIAGLDPQLPPHIERRLSYAFDLAQRGAPYTAEAEFRAVLGLCALEMDAREGGTARREALRQGLVALQEADQFGGDQADWRDAADVRRIAAGHTTPVLANAQRPVDSIQAVQAYYLFAEQRLTAACQGLPGASLAYYGMGRTIVLPGTRIAHSSGKAALFQRVALSIAPQNLLAANELGVLLAQHGQLQDAEKIFQQCVATDATPETWRNLAIVYARQGNEQASRSAMAAGEALAAENRRHDASQIAATMQAHPAAPQDEPSQEEKKPGFLSKFNLTPKLPSVFRR